ncbi:NUDIX hydrolase [Candidatus Cetobacterium colombiensis]|uniref:CoA pyrophosphatase n=1 Tax=Candidatus Cetobacterium colombiensis TaxID=3073100 RepID=A0ABU4WA45_9FUSO|nr:CoA pyrophosphatase [Candidatus Cetobacterium colombiensis]MDX8336403.1 CoA pyrophosphatase [Candidatus Cetobacterium colombiensis]
MKLDFTEKIIGKERYFNSAVIVLVVEKNKEKYFLFEKRAATVRQGGDISLPGGKIEKEETSLDAALRECHEEIGIKGIRVEGKIGTLVIPSGIMVEAFLGFVEDYELKNLKINEHEVEECFLVPVEFFKNNKPRIEKLEVETKPYYYEGGIKYVFPAEELNLPKIYHSPWKSPPREVFLYIYEDKVIWGLTAEIIKESIKYL